MDESNNYLEKLDKPLLRLTKRICRNELNTEHGQLFPIHDSNALKIKLLTLDKEISSEHMLLRITGWFIAITFSLAIIAACICTATSGTSILSILSALPFTESFIWIPAFLIIKHNMNFRTAVKKGEIQAYLFRIQAKWIHEYCDDSDTKKMYLVQFADVYTEAGYSYDVLKCGDSITVYIVSYKGKQYFGFWSVNPRQCP